MSVKIKNQINVCNVYQPQGRRRQNESGEATLFYKLIIKTLIFKDAFNAFPEHCFTHITS